jgi:YebC/PmpR family DNA-binding regulatory protein
MSGHSKWSKIKHKKAATDSKKSKYFGRLSREIKIAARGGKDPAHNAALRDALLRAKKENLPQVNIDRLLSDAKDGQEQVLYEGYGAGGVAVLVSAATNNTNRTVSELRAIFKEHGGSLGEPGSVRWKFTGSDHTVPAHFQLPLAEEQRQKLTLLLEELEEHEDVIDVYTDAAVE